jgi:hypothetical protein
MHPANRQRIPYSLKVIMGVNPYALVNPKQISLCSREGAPALTQK